MGTDHRINAVTMAAALLGAVLLGGCSHTSYEKITVVETDAQQAEGTGKTEENLAAERIGESDAETGIILETEDQNAEDFSENAGESGQNLADGMQAGNPDGTGGADALDPSGDPGAASDSMTILFSGDVLLSDHVLNAYSRAGGISGVLDGGYLNAIQSADYFVVNEEFPFSSRGTQAADKQYTFRLAPEKVSMFQEMGIDAVTLANNHALDYGTDALLDTCEVLDGAGILHTGAGKDLNAAKQPVVFEKNGQRVALIGATRVIPEAGWAAANGHPGMLSSYEVSVEPLLAQIAECHAQGEKVVVLIHWGIERDEMPQEYQPGAGKALHRCRGGSGHRKPPACAAGHRVLQRQADFLQPGQFCVWKLHSQNHAGAG